jgi:anaerobic selenocysteine-containing dehydrogenase
MELNMKNLVKWTAFNRRNFIKLLIGGAAGIHLTPLPWKLMDDSAIWTQTWPWIPVPPRGEFTHVKSVCQLCSGGCGIEVRKVDDRAVKIEGRNDFPVNPGGICPLGAGGLQLLYDETVRFPGPMRRVGPRGSGEFLEITWDEAIKEVAQRIGALRAQKRPEAIAAVDGNGDGTTTAVLVQRLMEACGSPNYVRMPTAEDTYSIANRLMTGNEGPMAYDLENADFILSFGCGLIEGWGTPGRMLNAWSIWNQDPSNKKVRVVQVEARSSNTASKADHWVAPYPGTEGALALGLAHVIIKEALFDNYFVSNHSFGFNDWTSPDGKSHQGFRTVVLQKYSPQAVAKITGVDPGQIASLARAFAKAKAPVALCGKGKGTMSGDVLEFMAVQALNGLVGNINKAGGVLLHDPLPFTPLPAVEKDGIASEGLRKGRLDLAGTKGYPFARSLANNFAEAVVNSHSSPVDLLLVFAANPAYDLPHTGPFSYAMQKVPFIVSFSPYRDETALMADLVLPDHTYLEKKEDVVWPAGLQYPLCGVSTPVVKPVYRTMQSGDAIIRLAQAVGGTVGASFPWKGFEEPMKARFKGLADSIGGTTVYKEGLTPWKRLKDRVPVETDYSSFEDLWKKLSANGLWYRPSHEFKRWEIIFKTPSKRFEFYSAGLERTVATLAQGTSPKSAMERMGIAAEGDEAFLPHFEKPRTVAGREKYPLLLMPYELINLGCGFVPTPPYLQKTLFDDQIRKNDSFADINPETAAMYGLKQGDAVYIESHHGRVRARVNLAAGVMPGVLFLPMGLGHKGFGEFLRGKGANPGTIVETRKDPIGGQAVWWETRVRVTKV